MSSRLSFPPEAEDYAAKQTPILVDNLRAIRELLEDIPADPENTSHATRASHIDRFFEDESHIERVQTFYRHLYCLIEALFILENRLPFPISEEQCVTIQQLIDSTVDRKRGAARALQDFFSERGWTFQIRHLSQSNALERLLSCPEWSAKQLHFVACDFAELVLHMFELFCPDDVRPAEILIAKRRWIDEQITDTELLDFQRSMLACHADTANYAASMSFRAAQYAATTNLHEYKGDDPQALARNIALRTARIVKQCFSNPVYKNLCAYYVLRLTVQHMLAGTPPPPSRIPIIQQQIARLLRRNYPDWWRRRNHN